MNRLLEVTAVVTTAFVMSLGVNTADGAALGVSGDFGLPTTDTEYFGDQGSGFDIVASLHLDPLAGPWVKSLTNIGPSLSSGTEVFITETLTNDGPIPWTDWHEEIISVANVGGGGGGGTQVPGFLFRNGSVNLQADYGAGFVSLLEGPDYSLQTMDYNGPPVNGNNNNWEAVWIFFEPHAVIETGDTLRIEKRIFEIYGDGNIWQTGESAQIAQYPTPEPTTALIIAPLATAVLLRRRAVPPA
jgi:hypothetical protein